MDLGSFELEGEMGCYDVTDSGLGINRRFSFGSFHSLFHPWAEQYSHVFVMNKLMCKSASATGNVWALSMALSDIRFSEFSCLLVKDPLFASFELTKESLDWLCESDFCLHYLTIADCIEVSRY